MLLYCDIQRETGGYRTDGQTYVTKLHQLRAHILFRWLQSVSAVTFSHVHGASVVCNMA